MKFKLWQSADMQEPVKLIKANSYKPLSIAGIANNLSLDLSKFYNKDESVNRFQDKLQFSQPSIILYAIAH